MDTTESSEVPADLITPAEAAKLVGVTSKTVRNWIDARRLAGFRVGGRRRVSREDVLAMVKRDEPGGKPGPLTKAEARTKAERVRKVLYPKWRFYSFGGQSPSRSKSSRTA